MPLTSPRFRDNSRLQAAAESSPIMQHGESDRAAVRLIQQALRDLKNPKIGNLPVSFQSGGPDGIYGDETTVAVQRFQEVFAVAGSIRPDGKGDGKIGRNTMLKLDGLFQGSPAAPAPTPAQPREVRMTVGTISWIQGRPNPFTSGSRQVADILALEPDWVPKTYLGLAATKNSQPPPQPDFAATRRAKDFRAMAFCQFSLVIGEDDRIRSFQILDAFHDPGFTPPFNAGALPVRFGGLVSSIVGDKQFHAGEFSTVSLVGTQARHRNTTITAVPDTEAVLVNSLVKFRAGKATDDLGVNVVRAPFHVPWVWCECVVTYAGRGVFKLYGRGSIFPTHSFYLGGRQVASVDEVGDASFPIERTVRTPAPGVGTGTIERHIIRTGNLQLFPVLSKGAPGSGPQPPTEESRDGRVDTHPNTVQGGRLVNGSVSI